MDIPPEYGSRLEPVSFTGAAVRDLEGRSDGEPKLIVWLGSRTLSEDSEGEVPGPVPVKQECRSASPAATSKFSRCALRPIAERLAREAEKKSGLIRLIPPDVARLTTDCRAVRVGVGRQPAPGAIMAIVGRGD